MAYKFGNFVWFECITSDVEGSRAFYTELLGWTSREVDMGDFKYTMLGKGESTACGMTEPQMEGVPNHFTSYVSVDDVDAAADRVTQLGGKVIVPPTDIPTIGRFSLVADPEGATFNLYKAARDDEESAVGFHWNELHADDIERVAPFYEKVVGWKAETVDMGEGPYVVFKRGDEHLAGGMNKRQKAPSMWLPYVDVADCDATLERAKGRKAKIVAGPQSVPTVGRFGVLQDPQGAVLGVITPEKR